MIKDIFVIEYWNNKSNTYMFNLESLNTIEIESYHRIKKIYI